MIWLWFDFGHLLFISKLLSLLLLLFRVCFGDVCSRFQDEQREREGEREERVNEGTCVPVLEAQWLAWWRWRSTDYARYHGLGLVNEFVCPAGLNQLKVLIMRATFALSSI